MCTTGQKEWKLETYGEEGHGDDVGDDADDDNDGGGRDGDCMDEGVDVNVMGRELTNLKVPPLLSKPHDQPYPTPPYASQTVTISQLYISQYHPLQVPNGRRRRQHHGKGNAMSGSPYNGATV